MCIENIETVGHLVTGYAIVVAKEYKDQHAYLGCIFIGADVSITVHHIL